MKSNMDGDPILALTHTFEFRGRTSLYTISFYRNYLNIKDELFDTRVDYSDIAKIKYTTKIMKIILRDSTDIKIQCTTNDMKKIKSLFKSTSTLAARSCEASAFVQFGNLEFFIPIDSTDSHLFRVSVIKRIAKFFYPAYDHGDVSLNLFDRFIFLIRLGDEREIPMDSSEDFDAALRYFQHKIDVVIRTKDKYMNNDVQEF